MSGDGLVSRATLASQVEDAIRADIVQGFLVPGQRLRAGELSQRYGVSATPLREALQRLAAQRLIDWDPRYGATVAGVSLPELRDIYGMRAALEGMALERSIALGDEAWEVGVNQAWDRFRTTRRPIQHPLSGEAEAWSKSHRDFHDALFAACDSGWLLRFVETLADHSARYQVLSARSGARDPLAEHELILRAALARDVDAAVIALRNHLAATVQLIEKSMKTDATVNGSDSAAS